jgi:NAD(P)-dependent dehydrogenase (short-subunit alcohol dehydrogenase family)
MPPPGTILITGASTGIGRVCAVYLAQRGYTVFAGVRKQADAASITQAAREVHCATRLQPIIIDVTNVATISAAAAQLASFVTTDGLAGLVNNAGIAVPGPIEFVPIDDWRRQFEVNLFGQIAVTQAMLPLLRKRVIAAGQGSARIVMMSSIAGLIGQPILGPYCASKHALEAVADALRLELLPHGVRTSLVEPGAIQSEIWHKAAADAATVSDDPSSEPYRLYGRLIRAVAERASRAGLEAIPASKVARAVERCLSKQKPPERVIVGTDARIARLFKRWLPASLFDAVIAGKLGIQPE